MQDIMLPHPPHPRANTLLSAVSDGSMFASSKFRHLLAQLCWQGGAWAGGRPVTALAFNAFQHYRLSNLRNARRM